VIELILHHICHLVKIKEATVSATFGNNLRKALVAILEW